MKWKIMAAIVFVVVVSVGAYRLGYSRGASSQQKADEIGCTAARLEDILVHGGGLFCDDSGCECCNHGRLTCFPVEPK